MRDSIPIPSSTVIKPAAICLQLKCARSVAHSESVIAQIDRDTDGRDLDLYAPDETTVAIVDLYARRHRGRWHTLQSVTTSRAMLVLLQGRGAGAFSRTLSRFGIKMKSPSSGKQLDTLEQQGALRLERIYEVPEGRRYALLTSSQAAAVAPSVWSAKVP